MPPRVERQIARRKGWQDQAKERGVFRGELAGQPVFIGIVGGELGLQAGQRFVRAQEFPRNVAQLIGFRHILGIIDREQAAMAELQRVIQGPGLWSAASLAAPQ